MDAGEVPVADDALASRLREKAAALHKRALMVAAAITVVVLVFPDLPPGTEYTHIFHSEKSSPPPLRTERRPG